MAAGDGDGRRGAVDPLPAFRDGPPLAVTFDFWDTLVRTDKHGTRDVRRRAVRGALSAHGVAIDEAELDGALAEAVRRFNAGWHANHQFTGEQGAAVLVEVLGVDPRSELADDLVVAFVRAAADHPHELTDGVAEALRALDGAGVRLGIICDVGMTPSDILRGHLDRAGVLELFDHHSFSDEVGVYKPDPVIFRHALDGLGVGDPAAAVHVGDLVRTDVAGARAAGMAAVRYAGANDDTSPLVDDAGPEGEPVRPLDAPDAVVHDHGDLPALLGLR